MADNITKESYGRAIADFNREYPKICVISIAIPPIMSPVYHSFDP